MKKLLFSTGVLLLSALLVARSTRADQLPGTTKVYAFQSGGIERSYRLHLPRGYSARSRKYPLLMVLHGGFGTAWLMERSTKLSKLSDQYQSFIVVYPNGVATHWNDGRGVYNSDIDDIAFFNSLIERIASRYSINRKRIYSTGISNGAAMSHRLACELGPKIRGIAPISGSMAADLYTVCEPAAPVAVLVMNGTADPLVKYDGGETPSELGRLASVDDVVAFWTRRNGCNTAPSVTLLPDLNTDDQSHVEAVAYRACESGKGVTLYKIIGGGHTWPNANYYPGFLGAINRDVDASQAILTFFKLK